MMYQVTNLFPAVFKVFWWWYFGGGILVVSWYFANLAVFHCLVCLDMARQWWPAYPFKFNPAIVHFTGLGKSDLKLVSHLPTCPMFVICQSNGNKMPYLNFILNLKKNGFVLGFKSIYIFVDYIWTRQKSVG